MTSFSISYNPFFCVPPIPYERHVTGNIPSQKVYRDTSLKFFKANAQHIKALANYTEIANSTFKYIETAGHLYLHHSEAPIEMVIATGDAFLYQCAKINYVVANRIFLIQSNDINCHIDSLHGDVFHLSDDGEETSLSLNEDWQELLVDQMPSAKSISTYSVIENYKS